MSSPITSDPTDIEKLVLRLHEIGAVKFGSFKLKSGLLSPFYIDLRVIVSFPKLLASIARLMTQITQEAGVKYDLVCGVPFTALPIATVIAVDTGLPMLMRRKEAKKHGTKKVVEGVFDAGQTCLVVEDLITSGMSVFETVKPLNDVGLKVTDVVVVIDREQGGRANLNSRGLNVHSVLPISKLMTILLKHGRVDNDMVAQVAAFVKDNQVSEEKATSTITQQAASSTISLQERAKLCKNSCARRLFELMATKKTNLCVAADVTTKEELLQLADKVGPHICVLKTHIDVVTDFDMDLVEKLKALAKKHNFLLFEDRKYADIGNTVRLQYTAGVYRTVEWAHIVNAHPVPGPGIVDGLKAGAQGVQGDRGLLLLAEMSSKGNLGSADYTKATVKMAEDNLDFVIGFVSQQKLSSNPTLVHMTPGVKLAKGGDALGQQYNTPAKVITSGADVIIVGRGVYQADDPVASAQQYRQAGWIAYERTQQQR